MTWMVYGANGYSGTLLAELAASRGERPILAGRSPSVTTLASALDLPHRVFDVGAPDLTGVTAVVNCAGPFTETHRLADACIDAGVHYLDITGELDVFEAMFARHDRAVEAGVVLLTGAGFDVVPTDCLAATLHAALPGAVTLELAFDAPGGLSRGTARTSLTEVATGARRRVGGVLVPTAFGEPSRTVQFPSGPRTVGATRWGDLVTAYRSTGIKDITVYMPAPPRALLGLMRVGPLRAVLRALVPRGGPSSAKRAATGCEVWGCVTDAAGRRRTATLTGPNAYALTADASLRAVQRLLDPMAGRIPPGTHTPSTALGAGFAATLDGVTVTPPS